MLLSDQLQMMRRRWRWILVVTLLGLGVAYGYASVQVPTYRSSAQLFITTPSGSASGDVSYAGALFSQQRVQSYVVQVGTEDLAERVRIALGSDLPASYFAEEVSAVVVPNTVVMSLSVEDRSPEFAQRIAQAYAEQLVIWVREVETPPGQTISPVKATVSQPATAAGPADDLSPWKLGLLGAFGGLLLGIAVAAVRDHLDSTLRDEEDVALVTSAPTLAAIPYRSSAKMHPLASEADSWDERVEAYRMLRTNLQFADVDRPRKVVVVTSAVPDEGKSTTSLNLAAAFASAGRTVLLIEADLRRPRLSAMVGLEQTVGLTTVLADSAIAWADVVQVVRPRLDLLSAGVLPPNPAEMLQSQAMSDLLARAREAYEVVLLDAPPLMLVTDAAVLSAQADGTVLIVRHGRTRRDQLVRAVRALEHAGGTIWGIALNMVPRRRRDEYTYYRAIGRRQVAIAETGDDVASSEITDGSDS